MDIINLNILEHNWDYTKRKIYNKIYKNDYKELPPESSKKRKKTKNEEHDFLQLFNDSDSLAEISPSLAKKLKKEEENYFYKLNKFVNISDKNNKVNYIHKRHNSSINLIIKKNFKEEKQENMLEIGIDESSSKNIYIL